MASGRLAAPHTQEIEETSEGVGEHIGQQLFVEFVQFFLCCHPGFDKKWLNEFAPNLVVLVVAEVCGRSRRKVENVSFPLDLLTASFA
jgi:hypothetical protein